MNAAACLCLSGTGRLHSLRHSSATDINLHLTNAFEQHLVMHASKLTRYDEDVRAIVVSYLQAKHVWTPSGAYAQPAGRKHHDPDTMDIGKVGDKGGNCVTKTLSAVLRVQTMDWNRPSDSMRNENSLIPRKHSSCTHEDHQQVCQRFGPFWNQ